MTIDTMIEELERYAYNVTLNWHESGGNDQELVDLERELFAALSGLRGVKKIEEEIKTRNQ